MPLPQSSLVESEPHPESAAGGTPLAAAGLVAPDGPGARDEPDLPVGPGGPCVLLRGTRAGLEIVIDAAASLADIAAELASRLEQSPGFFAGNDACVRVIGRLPVGALAR